MIITFHVTSAFSKTNSVTSESATDKPINDYDHKVNYPIAVVKKELTAFCRLASDL